VAVAAALHETHTPAKGPAAPVEPPKKKKGRRLLLVALVLALLAGGGFFAWQKLAGPSTPAPDPKTVPGATVNLDSMTLNLADGRFLKVGMALQLSQAATASNAAAAASGSGSASATSFDGSKALDAAITVLGQRTYNQLLAPGGRAAAQKALTTEVSRRYDGGVLRVYFTEFLMQ